jgi:hypothetical protein
VGFDVVAVAGGGEGAAMNGEAGGGDGAGRGGVGAGPEPPDPVVERFRPDSAALISAVMAEAPGLLGTRSGGLPHGDVVGIAAGAGEDSTGLRKPSYTGGEAEGPAEG